LAYEFIYSRTAVAAHLALYKFSLKTTPPDRFNPNNTEPAPEKLTIRPFDHSEEWDVGCVYAEAQNWVRTVCIGPTLSYFVWC
jgi:aminopeptidase